MILKQSTNKFQNSEILQKIKILCTFGKFIVENPTLITGKTI